jgi:hypothetical protein
MSNAVQKIFEKSVVNAPLVVADLQSKNTNNGKSEVRFNELICDL